MDLKKIDTKAAANSGRKMYLRGPDGMPVKIDEAGPAGKENQAYITLLGVDSDAFIARKNSTGNRRLKAKKTDLTIESLDADRAALLATCTLNWKGIELDGAPVTCDFENAKKLYSEFKWIYEQVDEFVGDRENFLPTSLTN